MIKKFAALLVVTLGWGLQNRQTTISSLKFLGEYDIPYNQNFKGTTIGGLSGIDYDAKNDIYYLMSDDRSAINPARFYTAKIFISSRGIDSVKFLTVNHLLQQNGEAFPSAKRDISHTIDPESIRYNGKTNQVIWTSEGERIVKSNPPVLINPSIYISSPDGKLSGTFPLPANLTMQATENGPRQNGALEGVTFDPGFKTMFVSLEEPLYEDGPRADVDKTDSWARIYSYDLATQKTIAQYAYALEPVAHPANSPTGFKINGISEILFWGEKKLLAVERSFSTGRLACTIKVFLADLGDASAVDTIQSLQKNPPRHPVSKKLLINMDDLGIFIDNVEGVTFGPDLPNGHRTLLFVSDNNFVPLEKMQLLLFELIP